MAGSKKQAVPGDAAYVCVDALDHDYGIDEAGAPFTGPKKSIDWLLAGGHIKPASSKNASAPEPEPAPAAEPEPAVEPEAGAPETEV